MARRQKKPVHRVQMNEGKRNIIHQLLEEYDIETAEDIQDALKDLLGETLKEMMEAEMDDHHGYEKYKCSDSDDYRNGYKTKYLRVFLKDGAVSIDNNAAEQSIRGFCNGKKNWVMIDTIAGAGCSGIIYSLVETV
jgi:putative transposase